MFTLLAPSNCLLSRQLLLFHACTRPHQACAQASYEVLRTARMSPPSTAQQTVLFRLAQPFLAIHFGQLLVDVEVWKHFLSPCSGCSFSSTPSNASRLLIFRTLVICSVQHISIVSVHSVAGEVDEIPHTKVVGAGCFLREEAGEER